VTLTAQPNPSTAPRQGEVTFTASDETATMTVTQPGADAMVILSKTAWTAPAAGGWTRVTPTINTPTWSAVADAGWVSVSPTSGVSETEATVEVTEPNPWAAPRQAVVTFTAGDATATLTITQAAAPGVLSLSKLEWAVPAGGGQTGVVVSTNAPQWFASSYPDWLEASPSSGASGATVTVTAQPNPSSQPRVGQVFFSINAAVHRTLSVTQAGATPFLELSSPDHWAAPTDGDDLDVVVSTNAPEWVASTTAGWLVVSPTAGANGATATVTAQPNTTPDDRSARVDFHVSGASQHISVFQQATVPFVSLSVAHWVAPAGGDHTGMVVNTHGPEWTADTDAEWLSVDPSFGDPGATATLTAQANPSPEPRHGVVTFTAGQATATLTVTQEVLSDVLWLSKSMWAAPHEESQTDLVVTTTTPEWSASSNADWVSVSPTSGVSGASVSVTTQANPWCVPRSSLVTFTAGGIQRTLWVTQEGAPPFIEVSTSGWAFPADGGALDLAVTTNDPGGWYATSSSWSWTTLSPGTGGPEATATLTVQPNPTLQHRFGHVTFYGANQHATVWITQEHGEMVVSLSVAQWDAPAGGGHTGVVVSTNAPEWWASSDAGWLDVDPSSGYPGATAMLTAQANLSSETRQGVITFTAGEEATATVTVTQEGLGTALTLSETEWTAPAAGGTTTVVPTTNVASWSAAPGAPWLSVDPSSGVSGDTVTVTAQPNPSTETRQGEVTFTASDATATMTVIQEGPPAALSLSKAQWVAPAGGDYTGVVVSTNAQQWSAESSGGWVEVSPASGASGDTVTLTAQPNPSPEPRQAVVTFTAYEATATVTVTQEGLGGPLALSETEWEAPADGGELSVVVTTSDPGGWSVVACTGPWLTASSYSGVSGGHGDVDGRDDAERDAPSGRCHLRRGGRHRDGGGDPVRHACRERRALVRLARSGAGR
jgi:hypothetical protein